MDSPDQFLRTQQVAEALGFSVSTIKRWVDEGVMPGIRTGGGHRLIRLGDALRYARDKGLPSRRLEALAASPAGASAAAGIDERTREALHDAMASGEAARVKALILSAYAALKNAAELADLLVRPAMERIGRGWTAGSLDVFQEHEASQCVAGAVTELIERAARAQKGPAPLALGASPEGDLYTLSVLFGELALREVGWDVRNLGPNLPMGSLARAVGEYRPRLVFLSVNHLTEPERFSRDYLVFHKVATSAGTAVVLGGRGMGPELRARLPYHSFGERLSHLVDFARLIAPATSLTVSPPPPSGGVAPGQSGSQAHHGGHDPAGPPVIAVGPKQQGPASTRNASPH